MDRQPAPAKGRGRSKPRIGRPIRAERPAPAGAISRTRRWRRRRGPRRGRRRAPPPAPTGPTGSRGLRGRSSRGAGGVRIVHAAGAFRDAKTPLAGARDSQVVAREPHRLVGCIAASMRSALAERPVFVHRSLRNRVGMVWHIACQLAFGHPVPNGREAGHEKAIGMKRRDASSAQGHSMPSACPAGDDRRPARVVRRPARDRCSDLRRRDRPDIERRIWPSRTWPTRDSAEPGLYLT